MCKSWLLEVVISDGPVPELMLTDWLASTEKVKSWPPGATIELPTKCKSAKRGASQALETDDHTLSWLVERLNQ